MPHGRAAALSADMIALYLRLWARDEGGASGVGEGAGTVRAAAACDDERVPFKKDDRLIPDLRLMVATGGEGGDGCMLGATSL